jgi:hypothetical protein
MPWEQIQRYKEIIMSDPEMITILKTRYDELVEDSIWLSYLEAAGVDNWEGFSYACDLREEDELQEKDGN